MWLTQMLSKHEDVVSQSSDVRQQCSVLKGLIFLVYVHVHKLWYRLFGVGINIIGKLKLHSLIQFIEVQMGVFR